MSKARIIQVCSDRINGIRKLRPKNRTLSYNVEKVTRMVNPSVVAISIWNVPTSFLCNLIIIYRKDPIKERSEYSIKLLADTEPLT